VRRREFITLLGGAAAAWPLAARAQQPTMALIGLLSGTHQDDRWLSAVRQGLKDAGYIEGRTALFSRRGEHPHLSYRGSRAGGLRTPPHGGCAGRHEGSDDKDGHRGQI
jgi:hypothetical protein